MKTTTKHLGAAVLLLAAGNSYAIDGNLPDFGQNTLQISTGAAVRDACVGMTGLTLVGESAELFDRCSELVNTGNVLEGQGSFSDSLDISADELAAALQDVAPEETEAMGSTLTDASSDQLSSIGDRLQFLRTGSSAFPLASLYQSGSNGGAAGEGDFSRLGVFVNAMYGTGDKESVNAANGVENGFDFDASGFTAGIDYRFTDQFIGGVAVSYTSSDATFDAGNDTNDTTGQTVSLYGSYYRDNLFFDGTYSIGSYEYDAVRNINYANNNATNTSNPDSAVVRSLTSTTDGDSNSWSISGGYNKNVENKNFTLSVSLNGLDADIDGYSEVGNEFAMTIGNQSVESLQSVVSAQASFVMSKSYGILVPFVGLAWHHEFDDDQRDINAFYTFDPNQEMLSFSTEAGDANFGIFSLGASLVRQGGGQFFFNLDTVIGLEAVNNYVVTAGYRWEI